MAITHFTPQLIGRGTGRSAVLAAAYRHCARMEHEAEARTVDYTAKRGLVHEEFLLPPNAPVWARALIADRSVAGAAEAFWNRVEGFEKRQDAQFAKEFIVALPVELTTEQNINLMRQFVLEQVLARGQVADWVLHDEPGNPHVHLMTSLRPLTENGFGAKKVAVVDDDGAALRNKAGRIVYRLWSGEKQEFLAQRQGWLDLQNQHLALRGHDIRVDGRSYAERGIDLMATTHIGVAAKAIQRKVNREGRAPDLERLKLFEDRRQENARRIQRRPEIVLDMVSREKSVFDDRDIAKALHRYIDDADTFQHLMARIIQSPDVLRLERETVDFETGEILHAKHTTRELIRIEAEMVNRATALSRSNGFFVRDSVLVAASSRHAQLAAEQRTAIEHVASKERIAAVIGRAGAGKTTMMKAAREAWEAAGYHVIGAALAGKAAEGLEREAGIPSRTLSSWELAWKQGRDQLNDKTVFVLDEAGMVASRQMATFVEAVSRAGAKLVLVGDPEQLQPIEAGAAFRAIVGRVGYAELETIYRQKADWMRTASLDLARGRVGAALSAYTDRGRVFGSQLKTQAITNLVEDWNREYVADKSTLILAHLRRDVRALNDMARAKLVERGLVAPGHLFRTEDGERRFASGDQIVFLKNDASLGVKNGMIAKVVEAEPRRIVAEIGEGEHRHRIEVDQRFYRNLDHGYATTIHKSQGTTVDRVKVLATLSLDRHLTYVAMTRHREDVALYYGRQSFGGSGGLIAILSKRNAKETTLDYARGGGYRAALRFANSRGLPIVHVARTLVRDQLNWVLRQKQRVAALVTRLRGIGQKLRLLDTSENANVATPQKMRPMIAGVTTWPKTIQDSIQDKVLLDPGVRKQWEEVSARFRLVFADPETALKAMNLESAVNETNTASRSIASLTSDPASIAPLKGRVGPLAGTVERSDRRIAEINAPVLRRDIERYVRVRTEAARKIEAEERAVRSRVAIAIPALSPQAGMVLERIRDAIDRNDLPSALGFALADKMVKAEIDGFNKAIAERIGDRALLANAAKQPSGSAFEKAALGLRPAERERLVAAWPVMRAGQQLAAHERTAEALKHTEAVQLNQRQGQVLK
ncbi:Ti-type conjugative transfer relaxase TraA [Devosia sp. UYZn731]|uniref:Ti-type conjugative transfer relaxase TraA n=1 Tax=Devosia sp. UYZn731 TaxID=3156345 RepID=UPI0033983BB5